MIAVFSQRAIRGARCLMKSLRSWSGSQCRMRVVDCGLWVERWEFEVRGEIAVVVAGKRIAYVHDILH